MSRLLLAVPFVLGSLLAVPGAIRAADICTGYIDSVPATISTQGVWCLRKDIGTAMTSGNAITIAANNVTIDCNDFKLGGLAAGDSSQAWGIHAPNDRQNITVRRCNVRGFHLGIGLTGAGHLVEDNRLDNNLFVGISVSGVVQRNRVYDTGGAPGISVWGIEAEGEVIDNTVAGVFAITADADARGIGLRGSGSEARGNRVRGVVATGAGTAGGIDVFDDGARVDGNHISATVATVGWGIYGDGVASTFCRNNTVANFSTAIAFCQDAGGNASYGEVP